MTETLPPSARKVQDHLAALGVACQVVKLPGSARTAQMAAEAIGCQVAQIVKSLVFRGADSAKAVLVVASGVNRVDERKIAARLGISALLAGGLASLAVSQQRSPADWLELMTTAVATTSYQGTVIRRKRGGSEALKVVHKIVDGVVNERVTSQEGNGLEIIRIGNDVHCILPDKQTVLVEGFNNQSTLFSPLPQKEAARTPQYDLSLMREGRIAGRRAVLIAVRPHDEFRYAHRIWLDSEVGRGTTVDLVLPRMEERAEPLGEMPLAGETDDPESALVLLVDDDKDVREVVRRQLIELGCPTIEASDAEQALERARNRARVAMGRVGSEQRT